MKRTTFIAPVESMRGNLSGKQNLRYANDNNKAFDAPEGRQYARNYRASYIVARRASDGLCYFFVKTKSATLVDNESQKRMACLGAAGAMVGSIFRQKTQGVFVKALRIYGALQIQGVVSQNTSFRKWLFENIYVGLNGKIAVIRMSATVGQTSESLTVQNPYVAAGAQTTGAEISEALIVKFWLQLASNPVKYRIRGTDMFIVGHEGETFSQLIASNHNFLGLIIGDNDTIGIVSPITGALNVTKSEAVDEPFTAVASDSIELSGGGEYFVGTLIASE